MEKRETEGPLILVVDEIPAVVKLLQLELGFQGMRIATVLLGEDPLAFAEQVRPDAVVVGAVLPTPEIYQLVQQMKDRIGVPLLFINNSGNESDVATALEMGADDSIGRPFLPDEMGLHLRALLRLDSPEMYQVRRGPLTIDFLRRIVRKDEVRMALGTNEWGLLLAMSETAAPLPSEELLTRVWGAEYAKETQFLQVWIRRLRGTLGDDEKAPAIVLGDIEHGFRLVD